MGQSIQKYFMNKESILSCLTYGLTCMMGLSNCQLAQKYSSESDGIGPSRTQGALFQPDLGPKTGRYVGLAERQGSKRRFHIAVDLAYSGNDSYRVFVRLSPGEKESAEYTSYYFSQASYKNRVLTFRASTLPDLWGAIEESGEGTLKGSFKSIKSGRELVLFNVNLDESKDSLVSKGSNAFGSESVSPGVSGFYTAQNCAPHIKGLHLEAFKDSSSLNQDLSPLEISGRLVQKDDILCRGPTHCLAESYTKGVFDPFSGSILLDGWIQKRTCLLNNDKINCDIPCTFTRELSQDKKDPSGSISSSLPIEEIGYQEMIRPTGPPPDALLAFDRLTQIPLVSQKPSLPLTPWATWEGQFYGYIYHQALATYQLVALSSELQLNPKEPQIRRLQPTATLYFGEGDSSEFIAFPFESMALPLQGAPIILDGMGDGLMMVRHWSHEQIIGDWYSKSFGYVGPLALYRGNVPKLPEGSRLIEPLSGAFLGATRSGVGSPWNLELTATPEVSLAPAAFYPLKIYGFAKEQIDYARRRIVEKGSYHFYTGRLFLRLDDQRVIIGRRRSSSLESAPIAESQFGKSKVGDVAFEFFWSPSPRVGTSVDQGKAMVFRRFGTYPEPRALLPKPDRS